MIFCTNVIFFYRSFSSWRTQVMWSIVIYIVSREIVLIPSKVVESKDVYFISDTKLTSCFIYMSVPHECRVMEIVVLVKHNLLILDNNKSVFNSPRHVPLPICILYTMLWKKTWLWTSGFLIEAGELLPQFSWYWVLSVTLGVWQPKYCKAFMYSQQRI